MESKFTWFPKLTATAAKVPEEQRGALLWALCQYGTHGIEPALEWPLDAVFEGLREDIDNSKAASFNGKRGGRGNKKDGSLKPEPPFEGSETTLSDDENPPLEDFNDEETTLSDSENGGSASSEPIPSHSKPSHTKPKKERRFAPPSVDDVRDYCKEKNYTFDPEQFVAFYESKGWKVGRNPMKSWQASCTTWQKRQQPKQTGGDGDAYSAL